MRLSRRELLKLASLVGAGALLPAPREDAWAVPVPTSPGVSRVALIKGEDRYRNVRQALALIEGEVRRGLAGRRVVIKPNFVTVKRQLAATHAQAVRAVLDFLKPLYPGKVIVAESPADASAAEGYANYGYLEALKGYDVAFEDLDRQGGATLAILDRDFGVVPIQVSRLLLDPQVYLISVCPMKTHDCVVATLSLKNVVMGAPLKLASGSEKGKVHQGEKAINLNLFLLAQHIRPHLSVIDGFEAMEGNGPSRGTLVEARVAVASTDFLAADAVALALMGIPLARVGYLSHCATARMGETDPSKLDIAGAKLDSCRMKFQLHQRFR